MMWMSRYILLRLGEEMGAHVVFEPKPIKGDWVNLFLTLIVSDYDMFFRMDLVLTQTTPQIRLELMVVWSTLKRITSLNLAKSILSTFLSMEKATSIVLLDPTRPVQCSLSAQEKATEVLQLEFQSTLKVSRKDTTKTEDQLLTSTLTLSLQFLLTLLFLIQSMATKSLLHTKNLEDLKQQLMMNEYLLP